MILQRLAEHYDRIKTKLPQPGYSLQKISFCIVLNSDGSLNQFKDERKTSGSKSIGREMIVPGQGKPPGQGLNPCLLWDNAAYMLGWSADPDPDKTARAALAFEAFRKKHLGLEGRIENPSFKTICTFLRDWSPEKARKHGDELSKIATHFGIFKIAGELRYVHEAVSVPDESDEQATASQTSATHAMCLVSGAIDEIARLHEPKIKGVGGAQSSGALLVSFNASAYESYGKSQSYNAPVGATTAFKYTNALNYLLGQRDRRVSLGDSTVVFWADHSNTALEDAISEMFSEPLPDEGPIIEEDQERVRQARLLLTQLRDGAAQLLEKSDESKDGQPTKFFILGLSPNASRISMRLWVEADAAEIKDRLSKHLRDIALDGDRDDRLLTLRRIVAAAGRWDEKKSKFDTDNVSPQLAGDLARSVLTGAAYPQSLLATMIRRIHSDGEVAYARVATIKACLNRNSRLRDNPLEVSRMLDKNNDDAAYCCGRAFALLEKVQKDSRKKWRNSAEEQEDQSSKAGNPREDDGPTIKDHYFSSASTTPSLVFPRLFRLYQHHLAKLKQLNAGLSVSREQELGEIMNKLSNAFPRLLSLDDQGKFVIGYFHQRQDLYTSKKDKEEGAIA
jgi:CRISPR-associated protein Csd1